MTSPLLLLVDDVQEIQFIVQRLSKRAGYTVVCYPDVPATWQYLKALLSAPTDPPAPLPDLLLLDLNLPGLSGLELCRRLRQTPQLAELPVAWFTQSDSSEDIAAGLGAGADFVVDKELVTRPDDWTKRIEEILALARGRRAGLFLSCPESAAPSPERVIAALNQGLCQPPLRSLGSEVLQILVQRAAHMARALLNPEERADWLLPAGRGLDPDRVARDIRPAQVLRFAVALRHQIECVAGTAATAPLRATLSSFLSG